MSQLPTNNDIPSNSMKSQDQAAKSAKPDIVAFEGETASAKRKKGIGFWRWMRKMFLSDQKPSDVLMNVLENQIVPGIKDNFRNSLVSSIDMFVYQNAKPNVQNGSNTIDYNRMFQSSTSQRQAAPQQTAVKDPKENGTKNYEFSNPCFKTKLDAKNFLDLMKRYDFPTLSVHTLYMMRKLRIDYTWDAYGWTREEIAALGDQNIVRIGDPQFPYMIDLPQAHMID